MPRPSDTGSLRLARRAWRLLHLDAGECLRLAERALQQARARQDTRAETWALLTRGFHRLYFGLPADALAELKQAEQGFAALGERPGQILSSAGMARALWRSGQVQQALELLLPLRDEGVRLLKHEQRGVLLNALAGCYSAQGRSEQAFAYMYEALRDAGPSRAHGFDAVLHCNLGHELMQLGDNEEALEQTERGLARCAGLANGKLASVLLINRVICLTELKRSGEALLSVHQVCALPTGDAGRGTNALHHETLALAALRAGDLALGGELVARAVASAAVILPDERVELAAAQALLARGQGDIETGLRALHSVEPLLRGQGDSRASLRMRCLHAQVRSELHEAQGDSDSALQAVREWQQLQAERARDASRARYQAAMLQTELLNLQHRLEENMAQRRAAERARAELAAANDALSRKIDEVQALQAALREQATHDALTGLANRRHLNDSLPTLIKSAQRQRSPLAVVVIDLDHFKAVNDEHGHAAGDVLLAAFGHLLRERLRGSDLPFRYGGEEFCLLLPRTSGADAHKKTQALLDEWRSKIFEVEGGALRGQSFSAGVAEFGATPMSAAALLNLADHALLKAKRAGRARVLAAAQDKAALP